MSVLRQANILGQQRLDVPHIRGLESSIAADFDLLAGKVMGGNKALVVSGFDIVTSGAVGALATTLQLNVAGGILLHPLASEHGTIFQVAADAAAETLNTTNANVSGSFTANQVNYVGLDLRRTADSSTSDLVMFLDANTLLETPKTVPLARTLGYKIVISTSDFASTPNLVPLAKVTTNSTNTVTVLEDARPMMFRLGSGGSLPNRQNAYSWPGSRVETTSGAVFSGGDKVIGSQKDWMDSVMTRLWELGGGQYWYSATSDRDTKVAYGTPVIPASGDNFDWNSGTSTLTWQSLSILFANSPVNSNSITDGNSTLADGECLYVDIDRSTSATLIMKKGTLVTLGSPTTPGSRFIIAWRKGSTIYTRDRDYNIGRTFPVATTTISGTVKLKTVAGTPSDPIVIAQDGNGSISNLATVAGSFGISGTGAAGSGAGAGGDGLRGTGAVGGATGDGGIGASVTGGAGGATTGTGGIGVKSVGGAATGTNQNGGHGGFFVGGAKTGAGYQGGGAVAVTGSSGSISADMVDGAAIAAGANEAVTFGAGYNNLGASVLRVWGSASGGLAAKFGGKSGTNSGGILIWANGSNNGIEVIQTDGSGKAGHFENSLGSGVSLYAVKNHATVAAAKAENFGGGPALEIGGSAGSYIKLSCTDPSTTTGFQNTVTPMNIAKAWGALTVNVATPFTVTVDDGFNISTTVTRINSQTMRVTLATGGDMATANYAVVTGSGSFWFPVISNKTTTTFDIQMSDGTALKVIDGNGFKLYFTVYGNN